MESWESDLFKVQTFEEQIAKEQDFLDSDIQPYLEIIKKAVQNIKELEDGFEHEHTEFIKDSIENAVGLL